MLRVLLYDKNLAKRAGPDQPLRVVIVSRFDSTASKEAGEEMLRALTDVAGRALVGGRKVEVRHIGTHDLGRLTGKPTITAVYLSPELEKPEGALAVSKQLTALSFSADPAVIDAGVSVGFVQKAEKIGLTVNLKGSQAEGADLDAELLALAEVKR